MLAAEGGSAYRERVKIAIFYPFVVVTGVALIANAQPSVCYFRWIRSSWALEELAGERRCGRSASAFVDIFSCR